MVSSDGPLHRVRHLVGIKNRPAIDVTRGAAHRLYQRIAGTKKAFLVRIENRDKRDLGKSRPSRSKIDSDQNIEFTPPQPAQNLDAVQGFDFRVKVTALTPTSV